MKLEPGIRTAVSGASDSASLRSGPVDDTWPPVEEWARRQHILAEKGLRSLGVGPERIADDAVWSSPVLKVLGTDSFAPFTAVRTTGKVIWCNFELARQLGFAVPRSNQLTSDFQDELLAALSFRATRAGEDIRSQSTITMYADKYGGDGLGPSMGAGRAGFLAYGNLYVKGIGLTPLFKHDDADDFAHSHGAVHLDDCLSEAVFGEVNQNLFAQGGTRILAIIDEGRYVTPPAGKPIPVALVVRAGAQLRPAHLLTRLRSRHTLLDKFVSISKATGQLVVRHDLAARKEFPDLTATLLRIIDDHASTAAEAFRWRMIHGALSSSNMDISGAMLDLPTQSTQPRTAPVWCLAYTGSIFGAEHTERAVHLTPIHRKLLRNIPVSEWPQLNLKPLNIKGEMARAYKQHLQVKLLGAAGLKRELANRIRAEHEELASSYTDNILRMAALKNRGPVCISKEAAEYVSLLDVFNLLKCFPATYFTNPDADHTAAILSYLKPVFRGNRFQIMKKQTEVSALVSEFAGLYRSLMTACAAYTETYYSDLKSMQSSITARAAFENEPLDLLYARRLYADLRKAIALYRSTGNAEIVRQAIDQRIMGSLRSVEGLLNQGKSRRLINGGVELEMRTIQGVNYSVKAWNDEKQSRRLHVSVPVEWKDKQYWTAVPSVGLLTEQQMESLRYRYTTDTWKSFTEAKVRLTDDLQDGLVLEFEFAPLPLVGRLEGVFYVVGRDYLDSGNKNQGFAGYVFAVPDKQELITMVKEAA